MADKEKDLLSPESTPNQVKKGRELSRLAPRLVGGLFLLIAVMVLVAIARRGPTGYQAEEEVEIVSVKKAPVGENGVGEIEPEKEAVSLDRPITTREDIARDQEIAKLKKQVQMVSATGEQEAPLEKNVYWEKYKENQLTLGQARQEKLYSALRASSTVPSSASKNDGAVSGNTTQIASINPTMNGFNPPPAYDGASYADSAQQMLKNQLAMVGGAGDGGMGQNMQDNKNAFFNKNFSAGDYNDLPFKKVPMKSKYTLFEGDLIDGIMISGINSDLPGTIVAHVGKDVYDSVSGKYLLIPQGTELTGRYSSSVAYAQNRVAFGWTRMKFPNGDTINLGNMAGVDQQGYAGVKDQVNNHYFRLFGQIALVSFFQAIPALINPTESESSQEVQTSTSTHQEVVTNEDGSTSIVTLTDTEPVTTTSSSSSGGTDEFQSEFKQSYGTTMAEVGVALAKRNMSIQPTLEVRPGHKFKIIVTRDMILPPTAIAMGN